LRRRSAQTLAVAQRTGFARNAIGQNPAVRAAEIEVAVLAE
jgi:hypothetical protein